MAQLDFTDLNIVAPGNPRFVVNQIVEDEIILVIINKLEMILFTNKGEMLGDPDFGADLQTLLQTTKVSSDFVRKSIIQQISIYIAELNNISYSLDVSFMQDPATFQDVMFINFMVRDVEVNAFFS
jgi:hypothetical protein